MVLLIAAVNAGASSSVIAHPADFWDGQVLGWSWVRGSFSLEAGGDRGVSHFDGELVRIELFADPLDLFGAFGMRRIGQNVEQVLIAPGASAILWRTVALSADAGRIGRCRAGRRAFFDDDRMFPVVAEVVSVGEAGDAGFQQAIQG